MERDWTIEHIPLDHIVTDETVREPGEELVRSMRRLGFLLVPIIVRPLPDDRYLLVDGSRRLAAARDLEWPSLPALVEPDSEDALSKDLEAIEINRQRSNLRLLHIAQHARKALAVSGVQQKELAAEIGMSPSLLSRILKVLDCEDLIAALRQDRLAFGAATALVVLPQEGRRQVLEELRARKAQDPHGRFPTVRDVEALVQQQQGKGFLLPSTPPAVPALMEELERRGVPCEIAVARGKQTRVRVVLTVAEDEREAIQELLAGAPSTD